jgi:hypothetical protein
VGGGGGVSGIKFIIFKKKNDKPYEIHNNYIELSIVFHSMINFFTKKENLISARHIIYFMHN